MTPLEEEKMKKAIYNACYGAIEKMGMKEFKKMSWFGSNWKK